MRTWLFKTEPADYDIRQLADEPDGIAGWDGVRNYQARNRIRDEIQENDRVLIYHSRCKQPAIVGEAKVVSAPYPDPTQFQPDHPGYDARSSEDLPRWFQVDIQYLRSYDKPLSLTAIRGYPEFADMELVIRPRLSVQKVTDRQYRQILALCEAERVPAAGLTPSPLLG